MNTVLGFDLGASAGWAIGRKDSKIVHSGLIDTKPKRFDSLGLRFLRFETAVRELLVTFKPDLVAFEEVRRHSSTIAGQQWGGYSSSLMRLCAEHDIQYRGFGVGVIKKHATGKGNASKELMTSAAARRYPDQDLLTDDVSDALHIMALGLSTV